MFVSVQVWKRWIIVSGPCMRIEQNEDITFPNLKKILLKYPILRNNLYWKMRRFASLVTGTSKVGSSHQRCSIKKGVFRNFTKVTGKHLCQSLFFDKVAGLRCATLLKKRLWHRCFTVNFVNVLREPFLQNTSEFRKKVFHDIVEK